jgi:hypothetical protein
MKMKHIIMAFLCVVVSQQALALGVAIYTQSKDMVEVDPVWSGTERGWVNIRYLQGKSYRTGLHHLKGLLFKSNKGNCYYFSLESAVLEKRSKDMGRNETFPALRGTGDIQIIVAEAQIDENKSTVNAAVARVTGYTDMVRKEGTRVSYAVRGTPINCENVGNF